MGEDTHRFLHVAIQSIIAANRKEVKFSSKFTSVTKDKRDKRLCLCADQRNIILKGSTQAAVLWCSSKEQVVQEIKT